MTREEAIFTIEHRNGIMNYGETGQLAAALDIAIAAMKAEPCEDCVSREAVLEITAETGALETQARVKELPLVIPKPRTGKWINNHTTCECCGWQMIDDVMESPNIVFFPFCPNCGAKMEGVSE